MQNRTRVTSLRYSVEQRGAVRFIEDMGIRLNVSFVGFTGTVEPHSAVFIPTLDFSSVDEAREKLEPQLNSWRAWIRLMELDDLLVFTFKGAKRELSPPAPDGHYVLVAEPGHMGISGQPAVLFQRRNSMPNPPSDFQCDALVEVGIALYADANAMPHHALKFAYAFLTLMEFHYGKQQTHTALHIAKAVLTEFRDLISRGGHGVVARKTTKKNQLTVTSERSEWLMLVFREMIRRHGHTNAGTQSLPQLTKLCPGADSDFPHRSSTVNLSKNS